MAGRAARGRCLLLVALWEGCAAMTLCAQVLSLLSADHWCADERVSALRLQLPLSHLDAKKFSLPPVTIGLPLLQLWTGGNVSAAYSQCERYDGDMAAAYIRWMVAKRPGHPPAPSLPSRPCDQGWEYDTSASYATIAAQHNWVCGNSWRPHVIQVGYWVGSGIGALVFGMAADKFGRYPVLLASVTSILLGDVLTLGLAGFGFSAVLASRFIAGLGCLALQYISLVHTRELVGAALQQWLLVVVMVSRMACCVLVAAVALVVPSWWFLVLLPALASATCLLLTYRLSHESPWWLLERDRSEDAIKVLHRIAGKDDVDPKIVDRNVLQSMYDAAMQTRNSSYEYCLCCKHRNETVPFATLETSALPTKLCRKHDVILNVVWMVCGASYYAQLQAAPRALSTAGDARLGLWDAVESCCLAAAAELPACALPPLLRRGRRRLPAVLQTCVAATAASSAACALAHSSQGARMALAALSRLSAAGAMCCALHLVLQCRLHDTRLARIAVTMCAHGLAAAAGTAINLLTEYNTRLPSLILAFVNFIGAMISLALSTRRLHEPATQSCLIHRCWQQTTCWVSRYLPQRIVNSQVLTTSQRQSPNPIVISTVPYNQLQIV